MAKIFFIDYIFIKSLLATACEDMVRRAGNSINSKSKG
jgi:hypothetical protein